MDIIVVKTNKGRLANQLWAYASIVAMAEHFGAHYCNVAFARYQRYFNIQTGRWWIDNILVTLPSSINQAVCELYDLYARFLHGKQYMSDCGGEFFLPPSDPKNEAEEQMNGLLQSNSKTVTTLFFSGWLFRNPRGEEMYKKKIVEFFRPKDLYLKKIDTFLFPFKQDGVLLVGVHIRQGDYATWQNGDFYYSNREVAHILHTFLEWYGMKKKVQFVLCSDGVIDESKYEGLSVVKGLGTEIEDLYTLAACDVIIGSNSTYGSWAAYYGGIPFIEFSREKIDWSAYEIIRTNDNSQ